MFRRALAFSALALFGVLAGTGLSTSAIASPTDIPRVASISVVVAEVNVAQGSGDPHGATDSSTPTPEEPVAEESSAPDAPVILVTGLAVLLAAILMVVRSGSTRRVDKE